MAVDPKAATEAVEPTTPTFAGISPSFKEEEETPESPTFSFIEPEKPLQTYSIFDDGAPNSAIVDPNLLSKKVDKFSFALGKDFSQEQIKETLANGQEASLRARAAYGEDLKDEELRSQLIREKLTSGLPSSTEGQSVLYQDIKALNSFKASNDPNTIVEKLYAQEYVRRMSDVGPEDNLMQREILAIGDKQVAKDRQKRLEESPEKQLTALADISEQAVMRQEVYKNHLERIEEIAKGQSWVDWGTDFGKNMVPLYSWIKTANRVAAVPGLKLQGSNLAEQAEALSHLPPAEANRILEDQVTNGLAKDNPQLAVTFMNALISYSGTEEFIDNATSVLDIASVGSAIGKAGVRATKSTVRGAFADFVKANADPKATPADKLAMVGDVQSSAKAKVLSVADQILSGKPQLNTEQVAGNLPSIVNPRASGGSLSAAQSAKATDHIVQSNARLQELLQQQIKVARVPEEALQKAFDIVIDEFKATQTHVNQATQNAVRTSFASVDGARGTSRAAPNEAKLMAQIEAKLGKVDWTPDGKVLPNARSAEAVPNKELEDKLSRKIEAKLGSIPGPSEEELRDPLSHIQNIKRVRPEDTKANIGSVIFTMTKPDGRAFSNTNELTHWAVNQYGLKLGDFSAERVGNGYFIKVERAIDETRDEVRNLLIPTNNKSPVHKWLPAWFKGGQERVSEFNQGNRLASVHGQQQLQQIVQELTKDIKLTGDSREAVVRVMEADRSRLPPPPSGPNAVPPKPGAFLQSLPEFEQEFQRLNGRIPTDHEATAYFTAINANRIDWILNNYNMRKQLTRMGAKQTLLKMVNVDPKTGQKIFKDSETFYARKVDGMDLDADPMANVVVYDQGQPVTLTRVGEWKGKTAELADLKAKGYDILHTFNPSRKPGKEIFGEDEGVTYIITKDHEMREVESHPITFREGWHTVYDYPVYVKQPKIRKVKRGADTDHVYEGDVVHVGAHTEAEGKRVADAMNQARLMAYHGAPGNLQDFLSKNLPYNEREFRELFSGLDPYFDPNHEFKVVADGETTTDRFAAAYREQYANFTDTIRSPLNLMNQIDKKFFGARDEDLHYIREGRGGQGTPVFSLEKAEKLDPYSSISTALSSMMRNAYMADYRISAVESWLQEFGDLMNVRSKAELFSDSARHLYNPKVWKEVKHTDDLERVKSGEAARKAITEFLGHPSPMAMDLNSYRMKMLNKVYESLGQKGTDLALAINEKAVATIGDPLKASRALAFHTTVGFLNPFHWFQNMATMSYAIAASPRHGSSGSVAGILTWFLKHNSQPAVVDKFADYAHAFGYDKKIFKEWLDEYHKTGRSIIEGDHALRDDYNDPSVFKSATGEFLDKNLSLFKHSEKTVRAAAHATAFLEWRSANPNKVLTAEIRNQILARSDLFTINMTRASAAAWQRGILNMPGQFLSFPSRLMDMMWSGRTGANALTKGEKARILLANSILYGVPVGAVGTSVGTLFGSSYEDVRRYLIENKEKLGVDPDGAWTQFLENGIFGTMEAIAFGSSSTLGPQLGPQGGGTIDKARKALWSAAFGDTKESSKVDLVDLLLGASNSALSKVVKNATPLLSDFANIATGKQPINAAVLAADMNQLLRTIKTWDQGTKLLVGLANHGLWSTQGEFLGEANSFQATMYAIFGAKPQEIADAEIQRRIVKDRTKIVEEKIVPLLRDYTKRWADIVWERGSQDAEALTWASKMQILYNTMTPVERKTYSRRIINDDRSLQEKMLSKYPSYLNQIKQVEE